MQSPNIWTPGAVPLVNAFDSLAVEHFTPTAGQQLFTLTSFKYVPNTNSVQVFLNGVLQRSGIDYLEQAQDEIYFLTANILPTDTLTVLGYTEFNVAVQESAVSLELQVMPAATDTVTVQSEYFTSFRSGLQVFVNGAMQYPGRDYLEQAGKKIFFLQALEKDDEVFLRFSGEAVGATDAEGMYYTAADGNIISVASALRALEIPKVATKFVFVDDFDAAGDYDPISGTGTDDSAAFAAAAASLSGTGGTVYYLRKHLIDTNLIVPPNVTIKGPMSLVGTPRDNAYSPYETMACLAVNSAATITLSGGAGLDGCLIYRKGCEFPSENTSAFAGIAVTVQGDDAFVINSQILGFERAVYSVGFQRPRFSRVWIDCLHGIYIGTCWDIAYINTCHCWPFLTVGSADPLPNSKRSGVAYMFENGGDWNKITDCFSYGYYRGVRIVNCSNCTVHGCGADSAGGYAGQLGFSIEGNCLDTRLSLCQAAAQETGFSINTTPGYHTHLTGCDIWGASDNGIVVYSGDVHVTGGSIRQPAVGVSITSTSVRAYIDGVRFTEISGIPIALSAGNADIHIGQHNDYGNWPVGQPVVTPGYKSVKAVASSDPLMLYPETDVVHVTGTTNFGTISGGWSGREVTLLFSGVLTVLVGGNIKLVGELTTEPYGTLTLICTGSEWWEKSRSTPTPEAPPPA